MEHPLIILDRPNSTLFVDYDGTRHGGHAYIAYHFGREPGELVRNFLLLDSVRDISDECAQQYIREWLAEVHEDMG
ncbi:MULTISPECIES: hypothetical protein [Cupriavidus]